MTGRILPYFPQYVSRIAAAASIALKRRYFPPYLLA